MVLTTLNPCMQEIEKPVLSLIIPTYNESENMPELIARIEKSLRDLSFELIVVDDNSPDGTAKIARTLNSIYGNITVCTRSNKLGLSSAVLHGFVGASGDVLGVIDADMQHPPEVLPKMFKEISSGSSLVIASRYASGGGIEKLTFSRRLYSVGAIKLAHLLLPKTRKVKDIMSGCFMIRSDVLENVKLNPIGFKILLEILSKCGIEAIKEVPYVFTNRLNGRSHLDQKEIQNYIFHLLKLFYNCTLHPNNHGLGS